VFVPTIMTLREPKRIIQTDYELSVDRSVSLLQLCVLPDGRRRCNRRG
jgi:hypothetical protein